MQIMEVLDDVKDVIGDKGLIVLGIGAVGFFLYNLTKSEPQELTTVSNIVSYPDAVTNANVIIDTLQNSMEYSQAEIQGTIFDTFDEMQSYLNDNFNATNDYINDGLKSQNEMLGTSFETIYGRFDEVTQGIGQLQQTGDSLVDKADKLQSSVDVANKNILGVSNQVNKVQTSVNMTNANVSLLGNKVDNVQNRVDKVQSSVNNATGNIELLENLVNKNSTGIGVLNGLVNGIKNTVGGIASGVGNISNKVGSLSTHVEQIGNATSHHSSQLSELNNTVSNLKNTSNTNSVVGNYVGMGSNPNKSNSANVSVSNSANVSVIPYTTKSGLNTNTSIVDALKASGVDSSMSNRKAIAQANGISNYTGTYAQNVQLLNLMKAGQLRG